MTTIEIINFSGLMLNILGTLILAFSLSKYLTSIHGTLYIHDKQLQAIIKRENQIMIAEVANLLKVGVENSRTKTVVGIVVIIIGFIIQLIPYLLKF
jgi:hypothetical protein